MPPSQGTAAPTAAAPEPPKFGIADIAMLLLALASVSLVILDVFWRRLLYDWGVFRTVVFVDLAITVVFLGEFIWKMERGRSLGRVIKDNWFDLLGMVPLIAFVAMEATIAGVPIAAAVTGATRLTGNAGGLIRLFRFIRIVRIVQAWSRFLRATNMTFGETVTKRIFDKYRRIIVAELTTPIMVAGITMTQEIVIRMKFLDSVGQAVDAKRPEIHKAVLEALEKNRVPQDILTKPLVDKLVKDIETAVVDTLVSTLTGPELNKLTQEMIVEVMENFKKQLQSPEGKAILKGMGSTPPATPGTPQTPT